MRKSLRILLIDDQKTFRQGLRLALINLLPEYQLMITESETLEESFQILRTHRFDLAFIDMIIEGPRDGLALLKEASSRKIPSIMLTGELSDDIIQSSYQLGARDYLYKESYLKSLKLILWRFLKERNSDHKLAQKIFEEFIGPPHFLKETETLIETLHPERSIFLWGETGTGKTTLAKWIHNNTSPEAPFINLNCAEFTSELLISELFGHKKGSFTGATHDKKGKLELANGGTLFLDEIAELPLEIQAKLLKAIEEKEFYPLGSEQKVKVSFQLISATTKDLKNLVKEKKFRADLCFRLMGKILNIPALREYPASLSLFIKKIMREEGRQIYFSDEAMKFLMNYEWPGNKRELKKLLQNLAFTTGGLIDLPTLASYLNPGNEKREFLTANQKVFIKEQGLKMLTNHIEKEMVLEKFTEHQGKIRPIIKDLKISTTTLYRILDELKLKTAE